MKTFLLASVALMSMISLGHSTTLPSTYAPTPLAFDPSAFAEGVTGSTNTRRSPFDTTTTPDAPYDVVFGNFNPYGIGATFAPTVFGGSSGADGTFKFVDGSPDGYNVLVFSLVGGGTSVYQGTAITAPVSGQGVKIVTLTGIGAYDSVSFGSIQSDSFEFAALSTVPLPASAPMFGGALVALGAVGYGVKRKKAAAAA